MRIKFVKYELTVQKENGKTETLGMTAQVDADETEVAVVARLKEAVRAGLGLELI